MAPEASSLWEVVGGAAKGGLVVRKGKGKGAEELSCRLSTGAVVVALEQDLESERMLYQLVEGTGPESGWVNMGFKGKALLIPTEDEVSTEDAESLSEGEGTSTEQEEEFTTELAMEMYSARLMEERAEEDHAEVNEVSKQTASVVDTPNEHVDAEVRAALAFKEALASSKCRAEACRTRAEQREEAAAKKKAEREEYEIGWDAESHVKLNMSLTEKFGCYVPQGMCCLVFDKESRSVGLAPTLEPSASVNLEYLSTALEVRRRSGAEPRFSLDPADAGSEFFDPKRTMLVKRFEPAWLAGTSVGEVLFQSDYHLKELSMGEHNQPVVGMKSCADFSLGPDDRWNAREWYVVRKAEVRVSGDSVLMPHVKMGVEAREQVPGASGLEDVPTTKPTHPMVRYAESFTHNFDLIAERKSVVYHLRELAKASVLAKFLMEADVELDDAWFNSAPVDSEASALEIPQLWHACDQTEASLYGGVQFGLDKFALSGARQPARMLSAGLAARQFVQPARHLSATLSAGLATRQFQRSFGPLGVQPARVSAGVGLDKFALSGARQPARMLSAGLAARQFVQPARHLSATLSAGLATRQFQRSFGPLGVQPARVSAGVGLDKFALSGARQPARMLSAGLAARQFVQPARHLSATLSAGLATRQFQRSFGPLGVQPARVSAGVGLDKFALSGARQPARMLSAGLAARQFVQPARHLSATLSAGLATRQFQRSFGPLGVQPARVSAGVGLDKFALSGARQPARMLSAGLAARQFVQPARHLSATLSAGLATRQFQRSFGPLGVQPARVSAGVGLDKFALSGARQPARMLSAGLAARQFVQPARHLSATLSAGLATRQFQRSFGPLGVQPARVSAGVGLDKFALSGARQPARMLSAGLAARQFVQPARHLSATLSAGLATRQFQRSFGPLGVQPARVSAGVGLDKFALSGARQPARMLSAGLAARQFVQPARHLSATLSAGLATRQFQRSFGPLGVQPARVSAGVGLDKFALSGARQPARMLSAGLAARQFVQPARHLSATLSAGLATRQFQRSFGPLGVQPARVAGVDLNLDDFNLSAPLEEEEDVCVRIDAGIDISGAFWSNLADELPSKFCDEDKALFNKIFNPCLSDRRHDGASFVPPDASSGYIERLRALVREEETAQQQRKDHFLSKAFNTNEPGPCFPSSWASEENLVSKHLEPRPAFAGHANLAEALAAAAPVYDEKAEDGTRFRIYQVGSLEVRTVQEHEGQEDVGAVFCVLP